MPNNQGTENTRAIVLLDFVPACWAVTMSVELGGGGGGGGGLIVAEVGARENELGMCHKINAISIV